MKKNILMLGCALMAVHSTIGFAAEPNIETQQDAPGEIERGSSVGLDEILVTARRSSESAQRVPLTITVVSGQSLQEANVVEVRDLARMTPNFQALTGNGDPSSVILTIRGQSAQDRLLTTDSPIGVYVDGVNYARMSNLETAFLDVERVEVLKGPQGTLFGKNTTGGAINISTKQPYLDSFGGYAKGGIGNYDTYEVMGVVNAPLIKDKLGVRIMALHRERGGFGKDFNGRELNTKDQNAFRVNVLFEPNDDVRWALSADYTRTKGNGPITRLKSLNAAPSTLPGTPAIAPAFLQVAIEAGLLDPALLSDRVGNAAAILAAARAGRDLLLPYLDTPFYDVPVNIAQHVYAKTYGVSSNFAVDLSSNLRFASISAVRWSAVDSLLDQDGSPYSISNTRLYQKGVRNLSQEFQFASEGNSFLDWIVGAYVNEETGLDGSTSYSVAATNPNNPNVFDADVKNSSWAVFGQTNLQLSETIRATLGVRWTEETREILTRNRIGSVCNVPVAARLGGKCLARFKNSFSDISYLASVDWQVNPDAMLYVRTARGFKGGGQNLRGNASSLQSFAPFKPETVTDYEVGIKSSLFNRRVRFNAAAFYSDYKDIQRTALLPIAGGGNASLLTNAAKARIQGIEADLTVRPTNRVTLTASGGITDAKYKHFVDITGDRTHEKFPFPKYSAALGAAYNLPTSFGSAKMNVNYSWSGSADYGPPAKNQGTLVQPAFGLLGARLSMNIDKYQLEVALFGKNLTQEKYFVSGIAFDSSQGINSAYVGEPRMFGIELTKRFGAE